MKYYIVTRRLQSMVHREGCAVLRRATHAKQWNRNPIIEDKFSHYRFHSCLSPEERKPTNSFWQAQKVSDLSPTPLPPQKPGRRKAPSRASRQATGRTTAQNQHHSKQPELPGNPNKYHARRVTVDGISFASQKEANRYGELKLLERASKIRDLVCQWRYPLEVEGVHICFYVADFLYVDSETGKTVVEDCKGMRTPLYRLKAKLMFAVHKIKILET